METITACENICRDFVWVGPFFEWLRNFAIVFGVGLAWWQLGSWKRERIAAKRADLGEELIAASSEIALHKSALRSPMGYGPPDGEVDDGTFDYVRRLKELGNLDDDFSHLRKLKVRQRAFLSSTELDEAIEQFFEARSKIYVALNGKIRDVRGAQRFGRSYTDREFERSERQDAVIWEDYADDGDTIRILVTSAQKAIEDKVVPLIRFENS